jgi:hypothetical protein
MQAGEGVVARLQKSRNVQSSDLRAWTLLNTGQRRCGRENYRITLPSQSPYLHKRAQFENMSNRLGSECMFDSRYATCDYKI